MRTRLNKTFLTLLTASLLGLVPVFSQDFHFDGSISRPVLENYLSRSISFTELLHDDLSQPRNERGVDPHDNLRLILGTGERSSWAGALMVWGREKELLAFPGNRQAVCVMRMHHADPDIILQAAALPEIVTHGVELDFPFLRDVLAGILVSRRQTRYFSVG